MESLEVVASELNRWWRDGAWRWEVGGKYRRTFNYIVNNLLDKEMSVVLSGIRRVGKTTVLKQLMNKLLNTGIKSNRILYFQFSESEKRLGELLRWFLADVDQGEYYVFLDELQYVEEWREVVKHYVDISTKIKFYITGSVSLDLNRVTGESMAGRIIDLRMEPLTFGEAIELKYGQERKEGLMEVMMNYEEKTLRRIVDERRKYVGELGKYLKYGEYPALLNYWNNELYCKNYLGSGILDKVLTKDIKLFEVEKEDEFVWLYRIVAGNMAQIISVRKIATEVGLSMPTIDKYLAVMAKMNLIDECKNRLRSIKSQMASQNKVMMSSLNMALEILKIDDPLRPIFLEFKGHIIENMVFNGLKGQGKINYFRRKEKEVDFVLEMGNLVIPVEIKSGKTISKTDLNHVLDYMEEEKLPIGWVMYNGEVEEIKRGDKKIVLCPFWVVG
jgi:uncharacterized protein